MRAIEVPDETSLEAARRRGTGAAVATAAHERSSRSNVQRDHRAAIRERSADETDRAGGDRLPIEVAPALGMPALLEDLEPGRGQAGCVTLEVGPVAVPASSLEPPGG